MIGKLIAAVALVLLAGCAHEPPIVYPSIADKGHLVLIGGGPKPADVVQLYVDLAGGPKANIVVLPLASEDSREAGADYIDLFRAHGAGRVTVVQIDDRRDAYRAEYARIIGEATGVFFSGGDQSRIASRIVDTPILDAVRSVKARGGVVGGTSAGTACESDVMLTGAGDESTLAPHNMVVSRGIGLFEGVVVDSHFVARRRFTRLQSVVLEHPQLLGIGVDEGTAAWVKPDGTMEVRGLGAVVVYDASRAQTSVRNGKFVAPGMSTYSLTAGQQFDLRGRQVLASKP